MIPELGSFSLVLALCFTLIQIFVPIFLFISNKNPSHPAELIRTTHLAVIGQFLFLTFAMICLIVCFLNNDLTVLYVREHSHHLLPIIYRMGAAWGGHEGSLLLWCLILSVWTVGFTFFSTRFFNNHLAKLTVSNIIMVLGWVSAGFIFFLFGTSNPFKRDFPSSLIVGNDLTPILQDPGLIFHPPMLYMGYVGFAIAFAFAIAALIEGKFDKIWAQACRPWVILPWAFLSCGIVLGSWWAYRELGWGGWWFWDPVENASLLPWLSATALIHSLIVSEKQNVFKGWTLLLAIITFALSLLGTFLVRSGVLVSVHAFASDPTRGLYLLIYLALIVGGALCLYAYRIQAFYRPPAFKIVSRETLLLINSVVFLTAVITIVIGTLYPIVLDAFHLEKISVGEPYFNTIFVPIMLVLLLLMGFAPHIMWGRQSIKSLWKKLRLDLVLSFVMGFSSAGIFGFQFNWLAALSISIAIWIIISTTQYALQLAKSKQKVTLKHSGMLIAHLGIAILLLGITINKSYSEERQVKMSIGETVTLAGYEFLFKNLNETSGPNYKSLSATFDVKKNQSIQELIAEQRIYTHQQMLSKTGILINGWRDLYVALGGVLPDGSWSVRIYFKPFVRWIWFGGFMLLVGGLLSILSLWKRGSNNEYI